MSRHCHVVTDIIQRQGAINITSVDGGGRTVKSPRAEIIPPRVDRVSPVIRSSQCVIIPLFIVHMCRRGVSNSTIFSKNRVSFRFLVIHPLFREMQISSPFLLFIFQYSICLVNTKSKCSKNQWMWGQGSKIWWCHASVNNLRVSILTRDEVGAAPACVMCITVAVSACHWSSQAVMLGCNEVMSRQSPPGQTVIVL